MYTYRLRKNVIYVSKLYSWTNIKGCIIRVFMAIFCFVIIVTIKPSHRRGSGMKTFKYHGGRRGRRGRSGRVERAKVARDEEAMSYAKSGANSEIQDLLQI